jgi:hypothetical protein
VIALVISLGLYRFAQTLADPDIWGHIAIGRLYHETGRIRQPDPFSYVTAGQEWINFEWLWELVLYRIFAVVGPPGLIVLKAAVGLLLVGAVYRILCRQGLPAPRAGIIVLAVINFLVPFFSPCVPISSPTGSSSSPCCSCGPWIAAACGGSTPLPRSSCSGPTSTPDSSLAWACLGIWTVLELGRRWLERGARGGDRAGVDVDGHSATGGLLAGHRPESLGFSSPPVPLAHRDRAAARDSSSGNRCFLGTVRGVIYLAMVVAAAAGWIYSRRSRSLPLLGVLLVWRPAPPGGLAARGARRAGDRRARRRASWAMPGSGGRARTRDPFPAPSTFREPGPRRRGDSRRRGVRGSWPLPRFGCIVIDPPSALGQPVRAIGLLRASGISGNLAIDFDWGLYAMYHVAPTIKISMDGRRETAYGDRVYNQNLDFKFGQGDWEALLREHDTQLALVRRLNPSDNLLRLKPGWTLLYEDPLAALFGRADLPYLDRIVATPAPPFPMMARVSACPEAYTGRARFAALEGIWGRMDSRRS